MDPTVALIKGDGTGPELIDATLSIIKAVNGSVNFVNCDAGFEWWQKNGGPTLVT